MTHDINGAQAKKSNLTQANLDSIAGMRTGSPKRKNESSVFAHLTENYGRESLKKKDIYDIPKPKVVTNNLS
jgi:hypothetical protein